MKQRNLLTDLDLRVLIALADNKGHPSWELEYILLTYRADLQKKMKMADRGELWNNMMKIDDGLKNRDLAKSRREIDKSGLFRYVGKIDQGNLSKTIKKLESSGWIYRIPSKKIREQDERGPKTEELLYIIPDKYKLINRILRNKIVYYKKQLDSMSFKDYQRLKVNHLNGTASDIVMPMSRGTAKSKKFNDCQQKYWHYVWLFWRWRARVKKLNLNR